MHLFNVLGRKRDDNHVKFHNHVDDCHLRVTFALSGFRGRPGFTGSLYVRTCGGMIYRNPRFSGVRVSKHSDREAPRERKIKIDVD